MAFLIYTVIPTYGLKYNHVDNYWSKVMGELSNPTDKISYEMTYSCLVVDV